MVLLNDFQCLLVLMSVYVLFSLIMCLDILSNSKVAEWRRFGKDLLIRFTVCLFVLRLFAILVIHTLFLRVWGWF